MIPKPTKPSKAASQPVGTQAETDEEIQRALKEGMEPPAQPVLPSPGWQETNPPASAVVAPPIPESSASPPPVVASPELRAAVPVQGVAGRTGTETNKIPYRPTIRPPVAELTVFDDGKTEGEVIRIRGGRFVIGRTEGDLLIPHDELISSRHVEITRQQVSGGYRWVITDLQSTNGLFIRVSRTVLTDGTEIIVGRGRYRFDVPEGNSVDTVDHLPTSAAASATRGWDEKSPLAKSPALTELIAGGIGNRMILTRAEYWIGSDPLCDLCRIDDPFCEPRHVRVSRSQKGGWQAEHNKTLNGLWYRVSQMPAESTVFFQIGEQRFRLRV